MSKSVAASLQKHTISCLFDRFQSFFSKFLKTENNTFYQCRKDSSHKKIRFLCRKVCSLAYKNTQFRALLTVFSYFLVISNITQQGAVCQTGSQLVLSYSSDFQLKFTQKREKRVIFTQKARKNGSNSLNKREKTVKFSQKTRKNR